jgi:chromosome partitioning protein
MIILIASQKGGCGKSTLAINIAVVLAHQGKDVLLVDADKQLSASNWSQERFESCKDKPLINSVQKQDNIAMSLKDLAKRYEIVIVDAAGRDSKEMRSAMLVADTLVIPSRPAQFDLSTIPRMSEIVDEARDINENLKTYAVITMSPSNSPSDTNEAIEYLKSFDNLLLCNTIIGDRKIFRDSTSTGLGVIELPAKSSSDKAGQAELLAMVKELTI